jgi:hypothetical protein
MPARGGQQPANLRCHSVKSPKKSLAGTAADGALRVRFTKRAAAARADLLTCVRADGSATTGAMPRQGILPHAAFHFVVEHTLGWREAFFGQLARGASLASMTAKRRADRPDWSQNTQAQQAGSLVACLQAEQWGGAADPATFAATLGKACRERGVLSPALTAEDLARVRAALREFGAGWRPLAPDQCLERTF